MSSMEEIVEMFADSISGFIMLSIKLQEQNTAPQAALRPASEGVMQAARVLVQIARDKGNKEYSDYTEIQEDIFDCCDRVSGALNKFPEALTILFQDTDRALGWRKLVQATQQIASQTSRLLLVVFGAEHRRLQMAGELLLKSCANVKRYPAMPDAALQAQAKGLVEGTNKTSSDLMVFNAYVQARGKETEGRKQQQLQQAVGQFNALNNDLVGNCNTLLKGLNQPNRTAFVRTVDEIARITREILDMLTPPEDLDVFKIIQDLYNKGNMAVMSQAKPLSAGGGRDVTADDLYREGEELKKKLIPVRNHPNEREKEDVASNTNVASAKAAKYNNLLADFIACDKIPALKSTLSSCHNDMNRANEELVRATNDYISGMSGEELKAPSRAHTTPARNAPNAAAARAKPGITEAAKKVVIATSSAVKAGGDRGRFVPAARDASEATKQLVGAVDALANQCPPAQRDELKRLVGNVRGGVVNTVQNGKALLAEPNNPAKARPVQESGSAVARSVKALLDAVNRAGSGGAPSSSSSSSSAPAPTDQAGKTRVLNEACKRIEDIVDRVNDEINPKSRLATHATITGPVSQADIDATAEEVLRRIRELRGYPNKTPKEIAGDSDTLSDVTARFGKQLEARAKQVNPKLGSTLADLARQIDPPANRAVVDAVNRYIPAPDANTARGVDGAADELERLVRATLDACKPKVELSGTARATPAQVTPVHIKEAAEKMKADNRPVHNYAQLAPAELAQAVAGVHGDATYLGDLVDKYANTVNQPALKSKLNNDKERLDDAKQELVRATDAYNQSPDSAQNKQALTDAAKKIDELADDISRSVLPDGLARAPKARVAQASGDDVERAAKQVIAAETKLADFKNMTPEELVAAANDASQKAAQLTGAAEARAGAVPNPAVKALLDEAARDVDQLNDQQHRAVDAHMRDPADQSKAAALADVGRKLNERAQRLIDELLPEASKERKNGPHSGHVAPKDIEREGRAAQAAGERVKKHGQLSPKQLVADTEAAFDRVDKLEKMLEAMEQQPETRAGTKAAIGKAIDKLHAGSDALVDKVNELVRAPEDRQLAQRVDAQIDELARDIDQIIADVKPKAAMAQRTGGAGGNITPGDLCALGRQVQAGCRDVQQYKQDSPQDTVAKTEKTSALAAKFADGVLDRAKHDTRPGVAAFLKQAEPKIEAANKAMVEATNAYAADPANAAAQADVDRTTNKLIDEVQAVLDKLSPSLTQAESNPDWNKNVTMPDLIKGADNLRDAVLEVKKFPNKSPDVTAKDSNHASQKLVDFCDDLKVRARKVNNPKHKAALEQGAAKLMKRNPELINATKSYLDNPDDPATGEDLDGVCDLILQDLDDVMKQINPKIAVGKGDFRGGKVSPEDLEALGDKVKQKVTVVEGFNNMAPAELAAAANDACRTADDFKEALKARSNQVQNPKAKKALSDGAALIDRRNEELAEAGRQHLADPDNKQKQTALATACQNMKDAVDEVLGRVRPRVTLTDPNSVNVGAVKPSDLEVTCDEVIQACTDLQGFRNDSPEETRDKGDDTSRKAAKYAAQVKKLAEQTPNQQQKKRLMDAYHDLEDANKGVVDATNDYLGDPESNARQNELHEAAENLKRAARNALAAARPTVDMSGDVRAQNGSAQDLRDAAEALKIAVNPLKTPASLTPDEVKDAAEDSNKKALRFLGLAKGKADSTNDPQKKALLNSIVDELNRERQALGTKTNAYLGDNSSGNERTVADSAQKIQDLVDKYMNAVKPRAKHTQESGAKRATDLESMDEAAENAKKAVRRLDAGKDTVSDDDELVALADDASTKVARFNEHVQSLLQETDDKELKDKLQKALADLKQDNRDLVAKTNAFVGKDRNDADKAALGASCKKTIRDIDRVMHEIREANKPKTFEDEIDEAALDIQEAVDEYAHVPQEIRDLAMRLADLMRQLAEAARKNDRPAIISISKQISEIIKQIQKFAKPYGDACKDAALQDTVYVGVQAMGNFGVQLKILASVKAASQGPDPAAENQLVACCEGISSSLRQTLYGIQSAKLKK